MSPAIRINAKPGLPTTIVPLTVDGGVAPTAGSSNTSGTSIPKTLNTLRFFPRPDVWFMALLTMLAELGRALGAAFDSGRCCDIWTNRADSEQLLEDQFPEAGLLV